MITVSAILCHHKGRLVLDAVESISKSENVNVETFVITSEQNFSIEGTKTVYATGGPARKRNIGFKYATTDYIAFFDDDVEVTPTAISEMTKTLNDNPNCGMVFGKTLNMEHRTRFDEAGSYLTWTGFLHARAQSGIEDVGQFDEVEPVLAGKSASCMIRREAFWKAGFFDESYEILGEETDLAWRVWLKGYTVLWCPQSVTYHAFNTRFKPVDYYTHARIYRNGCRNYLTMLFTNLSDFNVLWVLPLHFFLWFIAGMGQIFAGKFKAGYFILNGLHEFIRNINWNIEKRRHVQSSRKISDSKLFKIIMRNPPLSYFVKRLLRYVQVGLHG